MINLYTIFFLIVRILSNPAANVLQKKLSSNLSSSVINFYTYFVLSVFCIPFLNRYIINYSFGLMFWLYVLAAGFLCALGTVCMIKAINIGELSVLGPINSYKSIVGLIIAWLFLKETPSLSGLIGIILIIAGSRFIFETASSGFSFSLFKRPDIKLRFAALILTGTEAVLLKKIILLSSVEACFILWCLSGLLWSFIIAAILQKSFVIKENKTFIYILLIALCLGLMQFSTNYVFEGMHVGFALALFQLSSIVTVLFGKAIFHETNIRKKLTGSVIMIMGSCLILMH